MDFGSKFSNQIRSSSREAYFWLISRLESGWVRCIIVGKYPRELEKLNAVVGGYCFRLWVARFSSRAMRNPIIVTTKAVSFR